MSWLLKILSGILLLFVLLICAITAPTVQLIMAILYACNKEIKARKSFYCLSQLTQQLFKFWGTRIHFEAFQGGISQDKPIIFVSSHHSSLDILLLTNLLSKKIAHRKLGFISRKGLDEGLPSISLYLRKYCYSLKGNKIADIERGQSDQDLMPEFAQAVNANRDALVIFPEGVKPITAAEHCRPFNRNGLRILIEAMPDAQIVPIAIKGSGQFYTTARKKSDFFQRFPSFFTNIQISVMAPIQGHSTENKIDRLQQQIFCEFDRLGQSSDSHSNTRKRRWIL